MAYSLDVIVKLQMNHSGLDWHIPLNKEREKRRMRDIYVSLNDLTRWLMLTLNFPSSCLSLPFMCYYGKPFLIGHEKYI